MDAQAADGLLRFFRTVPDPRAANVSHRMETILSISILAVFCGCEEWVAVETWGQINEEWLATFLDLTNGIPSHDTFDRIYSKINPDAFEKCFANWTATLIESANGKFIAIDGKTLRHSFEHGWSATPVHMVSAFVSQNQLVLGQIATDSRSNEITAIPKLLALLDIKNATVTIDAMGCQREIAKQIIDQKGDYILALKGNQGTLHDKTKSVLDEAILEGFKNMPVGFFELSNGGHGRLENRKVWVTTDISGLGKDLLAQWPSIGSIVAVERRRQDLGDKTGKISVERQYFISSHDDATAQWMGEGIRGHWGIETSLHWRLDVQMNEDHSRLRKGKGAENFSRLRRITLNKLKRFELKKSNGKVMKIGLKNKQKVCGWSRKSLLEALLA